MFTYYLLSIILWSRHLESYPHIYFKEVKGEIITSNIVVPTKFQGYRPRGSRAIWLFRWERLKVRHYPEKFSGHRHCGNADIMVLVFHMILQI